MSIEPNARRRLRLVCATTRDPALKAELIQAIEEDPMSFVPSAELLRDIALCAACTQDGPRTARSGLCDTHRSRWNLEACMARQTETDDEPSLQRLVQGVLTSPDGGAQLLASYDQLRRALRMVWEAHARGAVRLPERVAETVERACTTGPRFLTGGPRAAAHPTSSRLAERMHS